MLTRQYVCNFQLLACSVANFPEASASVGTTRMLGSRQNAMHNHYSNDEILRNGNSTSVRARLHLALLRFIHATCAVTCALGRWRRSVGNIRRFRGSSSVSSLILKILRGTLNENQARRMQFKCSCCKFLRKKLERNLTIHCCCET